MVRWVLYIWLWCSGIVAGREDIPEILKAVPLYMNVRMSYILFDERMTVKVNNYETPVYLTNNNYKDFDFTVNELHAYYTAVSCTFAVWTASQMYNFVMSSTAFFQRHSVNDDEDNVAHFKASLLDKVRHYVNILHLFMNVDWAASRYRD